MKNSQAQKAERFKVLHAGPAAFVIANPWDAGSAVSKPVNFMAGIRAKSFTVAELEAAGVRRVSLATSLWRAAMTGLIEAGREIHDKGTFGYLEGTLPTAEVSRFMRD